MEIPDSDEIARSFMEWSTEEVVKWLESLSLYHDYSANFREWGITGARLVKLTPAALNEMNITEGADRVKILQHATTMRADLIPSSPTRRVHSPIKMRRFSEISRPTFSPTRPQHTYTPRHTSLSTTERTTSPLKQMYAPLRETSPMSAPLPVSPSTYSGDLSSDSPASSRMASPVKFREHSTPEARMHYFLQTDGDLNSSGHHLHPMMGAGPGAMRRHNRRSRSLDGLFQDGEDIFTMVERKESCSSRLVEILREENTSLKRELESYYQRVRKLQKLEQEVEHVREAQRLLEANTLRREKLEKAMRTQLEQELLKIREDSLQRKAEVSSSKRRDEPKESKTRRELKRRDTMIMRLIKQNKEATAVREQLEKDLQSTQAALKDKGAGLGNRGRGNSGNNSHNRSASEIESKAALMYTESIEKLKAVLSAMQNMSKKREELEKRLRTKLEGEIAQLKDSKPVPVARRWGLPSNNKESTGGKGAGLADKTTIAKLEADVAKWEQKCLELVAERQMAFEIATVPRDTRISQLQQRLAEMDDSVSELKQQKTVYVSQLAECQRSITELETRVSSLQSSLGEKESLIQTLQSSFLEPDDDIIDSSLLPVPPLSPVKKPPQLNHYSFNSGPPQSGNLVASFSSSSSNSNTLGGSGYHTPPPPPPLSPSKTVGPHTSNGAGGGGAGWSMNGLTRSSIPPHAKLVTNSSSKLPAESAGGGGGGGGGGARTIGGYHTGADSTTRAGGGVHTSSLKSESSSLFSSSPFHRNFRQFAPIHSHSAPNTPRARVPRKPRTSQPNLRMTPTTTTSSSHTTTTAAAAAAGGGAESSANNGHVPGKLGSNVITKSQFRAMKSKTPPPHYKVSSQTQSESSSSNETENKGLKKTRHNSTDGLLNEELSKNGLELFESLVGESKLGALGSSPLIAVSRGGGGEHRHSKSSPTPYDRRIQI